MKISSYSYTNKGGREHNEDNLCVNVQEENGIFILADGLGGHHCGEIASKMAVDCILDKILAESTINLERMQSIFRQTNEEIIGAQQRHKGMKTTTSVLIVNENIAVWGYVGDSRIYHFRDGKIINMTADHSVTYKKYKAGEISYKAMYSDEDRSSLLRALGKENVNPACGIWEVASGDGFLLCSDGFWEKVYDLEMVCDLQKSHTPQQWLEFMLSRNLKTLKTGNDNLSAISVLVF